MEYTFALCGHQVPAFGAPHSKTRTDQQARVCLACELKLAGVKAAEKRVASPPEPLPPVEPEYGEPIG